jgi:hypothetical protein
MEIFNVNNNNNQWFWCLIGIFVFVIGFELIVLSSRIESLVINEKRNVEFQKELEDLNGR